MQELLAKTDVNSQELQALLDARAKGEIDFILIDVREQYEYDASHVKGVDLLKPTSTFQTWAEEVFNDHQDKTIIFTCRTGSRSGQVQNVFRSNGHNKAINHYGGIVTYSGDTES